MKISSNSSSALKKKKNRKIFEMNPDVNLKYNWNFLIEIYRKLEKQQKYNQQFIYFFVKNNFKIYIYTQTHTHEQKNK